MTSRRVPVVSARKSPRQARSAQMVRDILQAAIRVLARQGASRFTAARVAEAAGVSVGSLYQYFPNKEAILFRLQTDEWKQTSVLLEGILDDIRRPPLQRVHDVVLAFFRSEWEEAALRLALGDAAPSYRDAPEVAHHRKSGNRRTFKFMAELLPASAPRMRRFAGDLIMMTMSALGKEVSERARTQSEVDAWALAVAHMLCEYLKRLSEGAMPRTHGWQR